MSLLISNIGATYKKHKHSDSDYITALRPVPLSSGKVERRSVASCNLPYLHLVLSTMKEF